MPHYRYQALNATEETAYPQQQTVNGEIIADSFADALNQLAAKGLVVQSLVDLSLTDQSESRVSSSDDEDAWLQTLVQLLELGRDLLPPLKAFAEELPPGRHRRQLELLTSTLERGRITPDDAATTLRTLPGYWIPLLSAAAVSRDPGRILREFLRECQQAEELRRMWWQTLAYPVLLLGLAGGVLVALSVLVIPIFREIFSGFGIRTPLATHVVLTIADWITSGRLLIAIVIVALLATGLYFAVRWLNPALREWWADRFATWMGHSTAIARFTQFAADLLEANISPRHALRLAGIATGSQSIQRAAARVAAGLTTATEEARDKNRRLLTRTVHYALVSATSNESRVRLLREISANHTERMRWRLSWARGFAEPLAIVIVGLLVACVVLALFMPLFNLLHALA